MHNLQRRNHRWTRAVGTALAILAVVQLPNAGTPVTETILKPKIAPLHRLDPQGNPRNSKVYFGYYDAWVAKYQVGPNGLRKVLWKKQLGTTESDYSEGVATDSSGNVFITGRTAGALEGTSKGGVDAWVAKYSSNGTLK
ncbi:MAG TPA: SBBP repeat-containing protein [Stenomitos sp.]